MAWQAPWPRTCLSLSKSNLHRDKLVRVPPILLILHIVPSSIRAKQLQQPRHSERHKCGCRPCSLHPPPRLFPFIAAVSCHQQEALTKVPFLCLICFFCLLLTTNTRAIGTSVMQASCQLESILPTIPLPRAQVEIRSPYKRFDTLIQFNRQSETTPSNITLPRKPTENQLPSFPSIDEPNQSTRQTLLAPDEPD